ncbi:hypothetical protein HYS47_05045 [Candidatus Woesearchaeota archaeon]|nr:hypothetical protein [Candidatus Woesearchaeota archaeon]
MTSATSRRGFLRGVLGLVAGGSALSSCLARSVVNSQDQATLDPSPAKQEDSPYAAQGGLRLMYGRPVDYLQPDDLAAVIQNKYKVCVGVGGVSESSYGESPARLDGLVREAAVLDYHGRCALQPLGLSEAGNLSEGVSTFWLQGGSYDGFGEKHGPAKFAFATGSLTSEQMNEISRSFGVYFENAPLEDQVR